MSYDAAHINNDAWSAMGSDMGSGAKPRLSVLAPYFKDDPSELIKALDAQAQTLSGIEIIIYDDGTGDPALTAALQDIIPALKTPTQAIVAQVNTGRSSARNRLQDAARADWILFLDADMRPVSDVFLKNYLQLIKYDTADVIFGGFTVEDKAAEKSRDLHRALSQISDCLPLAQRQAKGPQFVASSNLCMRKSVLEAESFDPEFSGWGWEDSEWAARIATKFTLLHADNPALHLGLETTDTLLKRFATSGPNYLRFTNKHPELAQTLSLFNISNKIGKIPAQAAMRPVLKTIIKSHAAPMKLRLTALKLWRASHYAVDLKSQGNTPSQTSARPINTVYEPNTSVRAKMERCASRVTGKRVITPKLDRAIISFSFDDCPRSALENAAPLLEDNGWRGTFYMATALCGTTNHLGLHMSAEDIKVAHKRGHEIAGHTLSHIDGQQTPLDDFIADIDKNQAALKALDIPPSRNFAYPYGCVSPKLKAQIAQKFELVRGVHSPTLNQASTPLDTALLPSMRMYSGAAIDDIIDVIKGLETTPQWLTLFTHDVRDNPSDFGCRPEDMHRIINAIKESGAQVMPMIDAFDTINSGKIEDAANA